MSDNINTSSVPSAGMAQKIEELRDYFTNQRKGFERRWYDNNFFDDGFHFRYLSRTTGKIVDPQSKDVMPSRAIPKASRQIRGVANLLLLPNYHPVVYPEKVSKSSFPPIVQRPQMVDPAMGQMGQDPMQQPQQPQQQENPAYKAAVDKARDTAKKTGQWLEKQWDEQELEDKLTLMVILAAKHGVSFLQCWPDAIEEKIKSQVYDAFDIYLKGNLTSIYDSPAIIKSVPMLIAEIKANEMFSEDAKARLNPDNKYASSMVKEAYLRSRFGSATESDYASTLILNEAFIKEYVNDMNRVQIQESLKERADELKDGDMVIRQTFTAGGVTLRDEYLDLPEYPFIDFRFEPGPIYGVPLIERFIPANKSLDIVMSRLERYFNTMVSGTWLVRKGENMQITNIPGGQQVEYTQTPPQQANMSNPQSAVFPYINMVNQIIEEQGASTSALNQIPSGVKSGVAIESIKQSEYSNLRIPSQQLKRTVKVISERLLDYGSKFIEPKSVYMNEDKDPSYFDVIGENGAKTYDRLGIDLPEDTVVIKKDYHVTIEVEQGTGFTEEGKKATLEKIIQFFVPLAQQGLIPPDVTKQITMKLLDMYGYGATQDLVEGMENDAPQMKEEQIMQMKIAVAEVLKEAQLGGKPAEERAVMTAKVGTLEALKESGMAKKIMGEVPDNPETDAIPYKDAPPSIKRQMEAQAGFEPASEQEHAVEQAKNVTSLIPKNGTNKNTK